MMSPQQRANAAMCVAGLPVLQIANAMLLWMACWDDDHVAEPVTNDSHLHRIDERSHHDMMALTRALSSIGSSCQLDTDFLAAVNWHFKQFNCSLNQVAKLSSLEVKLASAVHHLHLTGTAALMQPSESSSDLHSPVLVPPPESPASSTSIASANQVPDYLHDSAVVPIAPLCQYLDALPPLPSYSSSAAELSRRLLKDKPSFFFMCEIPCSRKYIAVARSGVFAVFDSACLSCIVISTLCCDIGSAPPPLQCAAVTTAHAACPPPVTIHTSNHPSDGHQAQLSPPRRRAPSAPRGDVLVVVTCHATICLYDLAAVAIGSFGVGESNGLLLPVLKISMGFKVLDIKFAVEHAVFYHKLSPQHTAVANRLQPIAFSFKFTLFPADSRLRCPYTNCHRNRWSCQSFTLPRHKKCQCQRQYRQCCQRRLQPVATGLRCTVLSTRLQCARMFALTCVTSASLDISR
jgi:hypothetical protein